MDTIWLNIRGASTRHAVGVGFVQVMRGREGEGRGGKETRHYSAVELETKYYYGSILVPFLFLYFRVELYLYCIALYGIVLYCVVLAH